MITSNTPIFIALFSQKNDIGNYQWGLVVPKPRYGGSVKLYEPVNLYQIDTTLSGKWKTDHYLDLTLFSKKNFLALINLPPLKVSFNDVDDFLARESPEREEGDRGHAWNSAFWVIRTLQRLTARGWFSASLQYDLSNPGLFHEFIRTQKALRCETALVAGATFPEFVGRLVDNVRVLDSTA